MKPPHGNTGLRNAARGPVSSTELIKLRVTVQEKEFVVGRAKLAGLKISEYIRRKILR